MNVQKIREDFPRLQKEDNIIYFDNASTSLKPKQVIEASMNYYTDIAGNTGRGSHKSSQKATQAFEEAREEIAKFIGAKNDELIFTKNTTESVNMAAVSLERMGLFKEGDEIVISKAEHHANLVPWQQLCKRTKSKLKVVELNKDFTLNMEDLEEKITGKTKVVAMAHASNTIGTIFPAKEIGKIAHDNNALFFLDGAQSAPDFRVDMKKLDADFFAFSSHKMLGPTGIGALYGKKELLEKMPPYNFGGAMITKVTFEESTWIEPPQKFETGTMQIAQAIGFGEAARYLKKIGIDDVHEHGKKLLKHAFEKTREIDGFKAYGPCDEEKQRAILLFEVEGIDPIDLAIGVDETKNIAIRSGLHCAEPIVSSINPLGLDRASFYLYNTTEEIDIFVDQVIAISKNFK